MAQLFAWARNQKADMGVSKKNAPRIHDMDIGYDIDIGLL